MLRRKDLIFLLGTVLLLFSACKKDELHFQQVEKIDSHTTSRLNKILFINDSEGFIAGGERFYAATLLGTKDGGNSWQQLTFPQADKGLYGITWAPSHTVYACGFDGKLLYSNDTGRNWHFSQMQYLAYNDIAFPNAQYGIVVGGVSFNSGYWSTIDSAGNFIKWDSVSYQLNCIKMLNSNLGYMCGYGIVQKTTDGGQSWDILDVKGDDFTGMYISNDGNELWLCGYQGSIFHSSNAGQSCERLRNGNDITRVSYHLLDIVFKDNMNGWAVGENGVVIYTDDGGHHWSEYSHFTSDALRSIVIMPNNTLLVAGDNGALYRLGVNP